jgi:UDP-N-acetylmuramyl tripeptide synthase
MMSPVRKRRRTDRRTPTRAATPRFNAVGTDSRAVTPGMLFVALKGERFDGHDYVREVLAKGRGGADGRAGVCRRQSRPAAAGGE